MGTEGYPIVSENESVILTETYVVMPDGVRLYTRYAVPKTGEKFPIVYKRTPYEAAHDGVAHDIETYRKDPFIQRGYSVLIQHCRGRGDSEGECIPYRERDDGMATLEFIRSLPFYNGEIYVTGGSYTATVHLCYLPEKPKDVKGACIQIQPDRKYYRNYRNGCNYKLNNILWWAGMLDRRFPEQHREEALRMPYIEAAKRVFGEEVPEFTEGLIHNTCDQYWTSDARWNMMESYELPTLFVEGWYDYYVDDMMDMWARMSEETKARSAMLVGPFGHGTSVSKKAEYFLKDGNLPGDYVAEWFDSIRENRPYAYADRGKITYYSIGDGQWRCNVYPKEQGGSMRLWLGANGKLLPTDTKGECCTYRYDPSAITNCYRSGNIFRGHAAGSVDGVLSFFSAPFEQEKHFFGKVRFHLNVSSDCEDTAFFMRVYFVEGEDSYNLTETVGAISYFTENYVPNELLALDLETPPIAFTVRSGMRIRVDISSESGVYLPHPNVKGHFAYVTETKVANNTVDTQGSYVDIDYET